MNEFRKDVMRLSGRDNQISFGFKCHQLQEFHGVLRGFAKPAESDEKP